jgi:hypothetical protein
VLVSGLQDARTLSPKISPWPLILSEGPVPGKTFQSVFSIPIWSLPKLAGVAFYLDWASTSSPKNIGPITIKTYILPRASQETRFMNGRWSRTKLLSRKIGYVRQSVETFLEAPAASCMEYLGKQIWIPIGDIDCSLSFDERRR